MNPNDVSVELQGFTQIEKMSLAMASPFMRVKSLNLKGGAVGARRSRCERSRRRTRFRHQPSLVES